MKGTGRGYGFPIVSAVGGAIQAAAKSSDGERPSVRRPRTSPAFVARAGEGQRAQAGQRYRPSTRAAVTGPAPPPGQRALEATSTPRDAATALRIQESWTSKDRVEGFRGQAEERHMACLRTESLSMDAHFSLELDPGWPCPCPGLRPRRCCRPTDRPIDFECCWWRTIRVRAAGRSRARGRERNDRLRPASRWSRCDRGAPDVVLLDLGLPDSPEATGAARAVLHCRTAPIVVLTAQGSPLSTRSPRGSRTTSSRQLRPSTLSAVLRAAVLRGAGAGDRHCLDAAPRSSAEASRRSRAAARSRSPTWARTLRILRELWEAWAQRMLRSVSDSSRRRQRPARCRATGEGAFAVLCYGLDGSGARSQRSRCPRTFHIASATASPPRTGRRAFPRTVSASCRT